MKQEKTEDSWHGFLRLCSKIEDPEKFDKFFSLFLTIEEREKLASRYLIVKALIEEELTQREIAETCQVSIAQITRGSNALKIVDPAFKKLLKTILR